MLNGAPNRREKPSVKISVLHNNILNTGTYNDTANQTINCQVFLVQHFDFKVIKMIMLMK